MPDADHPRARSPCEEKGSATIWSVSVLLLVSAAVGWALVWAAAESTRHSAEHAADNAALAAAAAALHRLAMRDTTDPCAAAAKAANASGAELIACDCAPLDCTVTVRRELPLLGAFATRVPGFGPIQATSRAGPADETGTSTATDTDTDRTDDS
jgi:secretion/DNA translocation related TadE-like protein